MKCNNRLASPADVAVYWIEYIAKYGKDSLKPINSNYSAWWKNNLLDVYAFLFAMAIIIGYIFSKTVKYVFGLYKSSKRNNIRKSTVDDVSSRCEKKKKRL